MSDTDQADLSPEDIALAEVLTATLAKHHGPILIANAAEEIERIGVLWATPETHDFAEDALTKLAGDDAPGGELRKAISSAWLARARGAIKAGASDFGRNVRGVAHDANDARQMVQESFARIGKKSGSPKKWAAAGHVAGVTNMGIAAGASVGQRVGHALGGVTGGKIGPVVGGVAGYAATVKAANYAGHRVGDAISGEHREKNGKGHHKPGRY